MVSVIVSHSYCCCYLFIYFALTNAKRNLLKTVIIFPQFFSDLFTEVFTYYAVFTFGNTLTISVLRPWAPSSLLFLCHWCCRVAGPWRHWSLGLKINSFLDKQSGKVATGFHHIEFSEASHMTCIGQVGGTLNIQMFAYVSLCKFLSIFQGSLQMFPQEIFCGPWDSCPLISFHLLWQCIFLLTCLYTFIMDILMFYYNFFTYIMIPD